MTDFYSFLCTRLELGAFSTEDTLSSFLPLGREVLEAHQAGTVAPLEGLEALHVEGVRIWFEAARRLPPRNHLAEVELLAAPLRGPIEVVRETQHDRDVNQGTVAQRDLEIGKRDGSLQRPVFLPDYVCWEHRLQHHDALTDMFSLGLILASLSCGLDLRQTSDLHRFVRHRRNLFAICPDLHPVLAQAICRMTELDRRRRVQDLATVLLNLENYRQQQVDLEFDLARIQGFGSQPLETKEQLILGRLKERLFELTRRNRLLHFRPTAHTVNLTHASVPLSFDITKIRPDQIVTCDDRLRSAIAHQQSLSLNELLNFSEAIYLPSVLDRILSDYRRDLAEFGFVQLRLVLCFLNWTNLKSDPIERFDSPLVLLPVRLKKKKGIRDTYILEPLGSEAEVNPVIRHQFQQLYGIALPETIDLATAGLDELYQYLASQIAASYSAVTLTKISRPRIDLIHEKAKRRVDQYLRRARLSGRGVRTYLDTEYSYDPANYHPLGIKLYRQLILPPAMPLRDVVAERPRPPAGMVAGNNPVVEQQRTLYRLRDGSDDNPYSWNFDLCSVTLANFRYRKMSLVRDYDALLAKPQANQPFQEAFSLEGDRHEQKPPAEALTLRDRLDVVPCDPTQAAAIARSRQSVSMIIQGPPGTGKSQTITNLIADFVARGGRVLFVCEKRAAIDVVYARLKHCGLADLTCLIHDSQADKKQFVMNLKQTYESLQTSAGSQASAEDQRRDAWNRVQNQLRPLERFDRWMCEIEPAAGVPLRQMIERGLQLRHRLPELSAWQREQLPRYADWFPHRGALETMQDALADIAGTEILASMPQRILRPELVDQAQPITLVNDQLATAADQIATLRTRLQATGLDPLLWRDLQHLGWLLQYARLVESIAGTGHLTLLDENSLASLQFAERAERWHQSHRQGQAAAGQNQHWRTKLTADETVAALQQARRFEQSKLAWMSPAWWRLRKVVRRCYDFRNHEIAPTWSHILEKLEAEHAAAHRLRSVESELAELYAVEGNVQGFIDLVDQLRRQATQFSGHLAVVHHHLLFHDSATVILRELSQLQAILQPLRMQLDAVAEGYERISLEQLQSAVEMILENIGELPDYLHAMAPLKQASPALRNGLRQFALPLDTLEAAVIDHTLDQAGRSQRALSKFDHLVRDRHSAQLEEGYGQLQQSNARLLRQRATERFLEHLQRATKPAKALSAADKAAVSRYQRGCRELEHEFGKSMRYKSIRDLVANESGDVIKDLKPIWLMSPLSVSDTLPLDSDPFDVVIFDEASQITLEEAIPSLFRARQTIVVGDEMQLPPTDFFASRRDQEDEIEAVEDGRIQRFDLSSNSFLNHVVRHLPSTMLGWHYRSRSESLISFSNWAFYDGRLLTVPEEQLPQPQRRALEVSQADQAADYVDDVVTRAISFHHMLHGVYQQRRNRAEADYIAQLVKQLLARPERLSLGVVAFSEAQQDEIETALERLAKEDLSFAAQLEAEWEREEDGQFVGLLVKNLENIQGDERDVIILSVCYGYGPQGKMLMNFGPINQSGGEKRLNVAFSRAKQHMVVVSSIQHADIRNEHNPGAACLKTYLRYADCISRGQHHDAGRILAGLSPLAARRVASTEAVRDEVSEQLTTILRQRGWSVDRGVGQSSFQCQLAVYRAGEQRYRLGILIDNPDYYQQGDVLEREMMRPKLLRDFGWQITHVLAIRWYQDRDGELQRIESLLSAESSQTGH